MSPDVRKFINRELSWLEFNRRVLDEACDTAIPLLERLKFLAISASNLDEFFMVRVGALQTLKSQGSTARDPAGMTPAEQLRAISTRVHDMVAQQYRCLQEQLEPELAKAGIRRLRPAQLDPRQRKACATLFDEEVFGVFTPMAVGLNEDFPLLANQTLNICVQLAPAAPTRTAASELPQVAASGDRHESNQTEPSLPEYEPRFAIIPLGRLKNRFITIPSRGGFQYISIEDLVAMHIDRFFPGESSVQCAAFRISRNADLSVREDMAADLLGCMEAVLDARKESDCVRLEISDRANTQIRSFLQTALDVCEDDVYPVRGPLDLASFMQLTGVSGHEDLKSESWPPRPSPTVDSKSSMFDVIRGRDVLLSLPFESFEPVVRLIDEAADDPDVLSIKITLYRTSRESPIVAALARAATHGKHVTAIVELKARFDEARNIEWAKSLEQAGVQVIYGVKGLKTHAKVCIIMRREPHGIQRYVHFSTGNYNEATARLYTDVSFLTCNRELATDATRFFNAISGYSQLQSFRNISIAPTGLRPRILELIESEVTRKRQGQAAHLMAQVNSLADPQIIEALYRASQAGVKIDLNVRGICCLRPGVPGMSDTIRAVSIVDRYLEHCRILYFFHGGDELVFISSADWMPRNLDRRAELLVPIEDPPSRARLIEILRSYSRDNVKGRTLLSVGRYERPNPDASRTPHRHQQYLYQLACDVEREAEQCRLATFEPHRAPWIGSEFDRSRAPSAT